MSINFASNAGERFYNFTNEIGRRDIQRSKDIENGTITTKEQLRARYEEDSNVSFDVLPDEWRVLANKKDKSAEEFKQMEDMYREGFHNLGNSYVQYIDKKYGNGDGNLTMSEYVDSEMQSVPEELKQFANNSDAENIFKHIDLDKNGGIDAKEMAAALSMFDMSVGLLGDKAGGINGKIKAVDFNANNLNLVKPSTSEKGKAMDEKLNAMYNFLFGQK